MGILDKSSRQVRLGRTACRKIDPIDPNAWETHLRRVLKSYARYYSEMNTPILGQRLRPSRARSTALAASCHMLSSVDFITATFESEFVVRTRSSTTVTLTIREQSRRDRRLG
jgi:hypothetical protein